LGCSGRINSCNGSWIYCCSNCKTWNCWRSDSNRIGIDEVVLAVTLIVVVVIVTIGIVL